MKRKIQMRSKAGIIGAVMSIVLLGTGCTIGSDKKESGTIRIVSIQSEADARGQGLRLFQEKYPELKVEFVDVKAMVGDPIKAYQQFGQYIEDEKPDVIIGDALTFGPLAARDAYADLSPMIQRDSFPTEDMNQGVLEWIKQQGGGLLTGLTPAYDSTVLFYNIGLFEQYGISHPSNQMSWEEVLALASRVPEKSSNGEPLYGLYLGGSGDALELADRIAATMGVNYVNWEQRQITGNSEQWHKIYELAVNTARSGRLYGPEEGEQGQQADALFMKGKVAMMLGGYDTFRSLMASTSAPKWGAVTQPVDPSTRDQGDLSPGTIYSVSSTATNSDGAWTFVQYMNSEERAKGLAAGKATLLTRTALNQDVNNLEPFTLLSYKLSKIVDLHKVDFELSASIRQIRQNEMNKVLTGEATIEEALAATQQQAEAVLKTTK
ncbi:ABC transporter substrate-binding protein [Paenibacillus kobensis]|uniref:ABC transporter substrate-binding protein n=1 Tax=Paenibacillus kobensis TaxID=59841 RepID=UPI000FD80CAF|nr:extracellular solute-binding protein [Paenibacillus kobensis]